MKTTLRLFFVTTVMIFFISQSFAQTTANTESDKTTTVTSVQGKFVDNDNNGICDNHKAKGKTNCCNNFVDKDGDGVCDNGAKKANCCKGAHSQDQASCCDRGAGSRKGQGKCCTNKQGSTSVSPSETPDPKK